MIQLIKNKIMKMDKMKEIVKKKVTLMQMNLKLKKMLMLMMEGDNWPKIVTSP